MRYRVIHNDRDGSSRVVAEVKAFSLEAVFELTNHNDRPWWENAGVLLIGEKTRSTSVGDVIEELGTGVKYRVTSVGFARVSGGGQ